jgi:hypothetical protein
MTEEGLLLVYGEPGSAVSEAEFNGPSIVVVPFAFLTLHWIL